MKILSVLLFLMPSFIHVSIRRMMGSSIGKGTTIRFGTLIISNRITIGENVKIGPFTYINSNQLKVDDHSIIKSLSAISALEVTLGKYVHVAPLVVIMGDHTENSYFRVGDHSRIFPFCWIETGEGVQIGKNVGVGGHSLIFTHGVWSDYLDGGPVSYGPVSIKDNVWLPWRVFILPNVVIGSNSIIGANSLVNRSIPENVVAAGSPAKVVKDVAIESITEEEKRERVAFILGKFSAHIYFKFKIQSTIKNEGIVFETFKIIIDDDSLVSKGDLIFFVNSKIVNNELNDLVSRGVSVIDHSGKRAQILPGNCIHTELISFLRRFGIRLYLK